MPKIEIKAEKIQTREPGSVVTREAGKVVQAGRGNQRQQEPKATAEAGRDATGQVEDAAKAAAIKAARTAARTASALKAQRAADAPPLPVRPDLDTHFIALPNAPMPELPTVEGPTLDATPQLPHGPIPELPLPTAAPSIADGAVAISRAQAAPPTEPRHLWQSPGGAQSMAVGRWADLSPEQVSGRKNESQIKQPLGANKPVKDYRQSRLENAGPQVHHRGPAVESPILSGPPLTGPTPFGPPPPGTQATPWPVQARPTTAHNHVPPAEPVAIKAAKKKLQIKRFLARRAQNGRDILEQSRTAERRLAGLFCAPGEVSDPPPPALSTKNQRPPAPKRTLPRKENPRATHTISRRAGWGGVPQTAGRQAERSAKALAVRKARRAAAEKAVHGAVATGKGATAIVNRVSVAVATGVKALAAALGPVVGVVVAIIAVVILVAAAAAVLGSPFGVLFANENTAPDTIPISTAVGQLNMAFSDKLTALQEPGYDDVVIHGAMADWPEILAVFAVKTAGTTGEEAVDVITIDENRVALLSDLFWAMNPVRTEVEVVTNGDGTTSTILHIYIEGKTAEEMAAAFTPDQKKMLEELLTNYGPLLAGLCADLTIPGGNASDVAAALPEELSPARRTAVETALSLVGKLSYFWGGKSYHIGWDDRWGQLTKVTAAGSSTTGTWIPYGLDCTGYLDWSFRNAGLPSAGHWYLETNLTETTWAEAQPGDIALFPDNSHVGLVVGRDGGGRVLVVHCSFSLNNVAISDAQAFGFTKVGVPGIYN